MILRKILTALCAAACILSTANASAPFANGDRWTVVGDSITHGGQYYTWVYLYYATRFPELQIDVSNAGNSGDDAHGALKRYDWDIRSNKPTVASIMFGMNDVRREIYGDMPLTNQLRDQRTYILEGYRSFMTQLVKRIQADGTRVILITPSIYDETARNPKSGVLTGVNGALGECASFLGNLAGETGATLVDFHAPMTKINARMQARDPSASLIKPDRVHPNPVGHFVMGYLFLKAIGAPGIVSSVTIDAKASKVAGVENATVESLVAGENGITFTLHEKAIPFPIGKNEQPALEWVPFQDEFNREILKVTGLARGEYSLSIDGKPVRRFKFDELAAGANLALEPNTPQSVQSAKVLGLMEAWHQQIQELRTIGSFEFWRLGAVPHPISLETARKHVEPEIEKLKDATSESDKQARNSCVRYLEAKAHETELRTKVGEIAAEIRATARPQPHAYRLEPVK